MKKYFFCFTVCAVIIVFSISCSNTKPEIPYGFLQLVLYQEDSGPQEHFSFFIIAQDDDGLENLDELYLCHDREQLRWEIKSDEWISYTHEGQNWIGTRSIAVKEGSLPRGVYRAVLVNKGGEKTERSFTFDGVVRFPFPELEIVDGTYTVKSEWPVNRFVCYDGQGNYSTTIELTALTGTVSQLRLSANVRTIALWVEDEENFTSAFTNVIAVN